jgi:transposase
MTESLPDPLKLEPVGVSSDGRRHYYDAQAKQKVVEACLQPGVSLAGVALRAGVNANLLRRWVKLHQQQHNGAAATQVVESAPPAFVPVVEISRADAQPGQPRQPRLLPAGHEPVRTLPRPSVPSRLTVEMPNGITLKLECGGQDATLISAMIETLGRYHVPAGR